MENGILTAGQSNKQMEVTCPHIIWRISPFSTVTDKVTQSFTFLNSDWRWEYVVRSKDDEGLPNRIVSIYLKRLSEVYDCPIKQFATIVSIKDSEGNKHAAKIFSCYISPLVTWCVWKKSITYILSHNLIQHDSCTFSLSIEPLGNFDDLTMLRSDEKLCTVSCLDELRRDFNNLLRVSDHADIILKCGNKVIKAHKAVLRFRSKKFAHMLEHACNPSEIYEKKFLDELLLTDIDPDVFEILIHYIYTACLPDLTVELARNVYEAADEYFIKSLKKRCARFMIENLSSSETVGILLLADKCNDEYLKWAVSSHIAYDLNILHSEEWKTFAKTNQKLTIDVFQIFTQRMYERLPLSSDTSD